jgi:serine phosphatase RsbU (regulator of sigma subunit)/anti-sigma regulatory factor (Ser/Thr protein kinase)
MATGEALTLSRLLERREAQSQLNAFARVQPGAHFALLRADGRPFAASEGFPAELLASGNGAVRSYPLAAADQQVGTLFVHDPSDAAGLLAQALHQCLTLLLAQAAARRQIAGEALEGYKEINLLYHLSELLDVSLDAPAIAAVVLEESRRAIASDAGTILRWDEGRPGDSYGESVAPGVNLDTLARGALAPLLPGDRAMILTDVPAASGYAVFLWAPLRMQSQTMGGILLARRAARPVFTAGDEKLLVTLGREAAIAMQNARLHQVALEKQRLDHELHLGHEMQASLMPRATPVIRGWEFVDWWQPAREVSGDFYDFIPLEQQVDLVIADVSDKGVAAALFMADTRSTVRASVSATRSAARALTQANRLLCADALDGTFVTLFYAQLDPFLNQLTYVNAGHNPPLLFCASDQTLLDLSRTGIMLGFDEKFEFEQRMVRLHRDDVLVLYTDGVTEAVNAQREQFGEERLRAIVLANNQRPAADILRILRGALTEFMGGEEPYDDITVIVARCVAPAGGVMSVLGGAGPRFVYSAGAELASLALFRSFIERACAEAGLDPDVCFQLSLVVDEACTNIIQYGYAGLPRSSIEVGLAREGQRVVLTITDRARPFDPSQAPVPDLDSGWEQRPIGGLGWHLIRSLMDDVHYESHPDGRNVLTLAKRLDTKTEA